MAFSYNHVTLVGRLVKDPEWFPEDEVSQRATFSLAIERGYKKENGKPFVDFIPIIIWGKMANAAHAILKKGTPALVWGRIHVKSYQGDVGRKWSMEIVADNFQVLQSRADESVPALIEDSE
jgi:single-strand DNA-binding protein